MTRPRPGDAVAIGLGEAMAQGSARRSKAMRAGAFIGVAALGSVGLASAVGNDDKGAGAAPGTARATLLDASGAKVGKVRFRSVRDGALLVRVSVKGLTPGFHGFHVHETGACDAGFSGAGGHDNPTAQTHGAHAGDMPPLLVGSDGRANARFTTSSLTLDGLVDASGDGSAVIVHAGSDNLANIPSTYHSHLPAATSTTFGPDAGTKATGDGGARVVCGVVRGAKALR
jgi:Cu-Zn family superoxide dismutase